MAPKDGTAKATERTAPSKRGSIAPDHMFAKVSEQEAWCGPTPEAEIQHRARLPLRIRSPIYAAFDLCLRADCLAD